MFVCERERERSAHSLLKDLTEEHAAIAELNPVTEHVNTRENKATVVKVLSSKRQSGTYTSVLINGVFTKI